MTANPADAVREALTRFRFYEGYAWDGGADVGSMQEEPDGDYVLYDDHARIVAALSAQLAQWLDANGPGGWIDDLRQRAKDADVAETKLTAINGLARIANAAIKERP